MKIYCINLDRSVERLAHMQRVFSALDLPFTRFAAVDGAGIIDRPLVPAGEKGLTSGELGCVRSHRAIWDEFAAGGEPYAAVFEDDIHVSGALKAFLRDVDILGALPGDADLVKLESMGIVVQVDRKPVASLGGVVLYRLRSSHLGTAGYLVSRNAARRLSEYLAGDRMTADQIFDETAMAQRGLIVLQTRQALVVQDAFARKFANRFDFGSVIDEMDVSRKVTKHSPQVKILREIQRGVARVVENLSWCFSSERKSQIRLRIKFAGEEV